MKQNNRVDFLKRIIIFIVPLFLIVGFFEYYLASVDNSVSIKKKYLLAQSNSIEVLILGSSHANANINPDFFSKKAFNLGNIAQDIYYDSQLIDKTMPNLPNLKMVIWVVSYPSFEYRLVKRPDYWRTFFYTHAYGITNENTWLIFDPRSWSLFALYEPKNSLIYATKWFDVNLVPEVHLNGWTPVESHRKITISEQGGRDLVKLHESAMDPHYISQSKQLLIDEIKKLEQKNIQVALITPPAFHTYTEAMDSAHYQNMLSLIAAVQTETNTLYANYINDNRFDLEDFGDNDHLNSQGAQKFSAILDREIITKSSFLP